ncbi:MAG: hypothetical protein JW885_14625 [Deltaproteobacteria bacterium]|nr:hypothetical protein [Candidatus Zymogenaceae bacterium]
MTSKKKHTPKEYGNVSGTDTDDVYLPVCCGEFGLRQAASFRELWEATWSQDRRGRVENVKESSSPRSGDHDRDTEEESSKE